MITRFLSIHLSNMRRIFAVMIAFGLMIGLIFPVIVEPFVTWQPGLKVYFRLACLVAGFVVGTFCYYLVRVTLFRSSMLLEKRKAELEAAKDRFSFLTSLAITSRNWDVSFHDAHVPTCWKLKNCDNDECPCFGKDDLRCWLVSGTYCGGEVQGRFAQKIDNCSQCEVYQQAVQQDPINEIAENFNSLMWVVKEREDELFSAKEKLQEQFVELERMHEKVKEAAVTDALTGLKNHGHFQHYLQGEVERANRYQRSLSLIMIDLDFFKSINDNYGHQRGDQVLSGLGRMLLQELRGIDYAARYGGEEFAIIMPETEGQAAVNVADRLREKMAVVATGAGLPDGCVSASFGVADLPACAVDNNSLIAASDSALLFSKNKGRNRVTYFRDLSQTDLAASDIGSLNQRLEGASMDTICSLAEAVNARDKYSSSEARIFSGIAETMAKKLKLSGKQSESLALATVLYDIGKICIPDSVLNKTEKLSPAEIAIIQQHPDIGRKIMHEAEQIQDLESAILYHHERWDGNGYPSKLKGEEIPLLARIIGIFDAYRAMAADRPYRKALDPKAIIAELRQGAGAQFDPELVEIFIGTIQGISEEGIIKAS